MGRRSYFRRRRFLPARLLFVLACLLSGLWLAGFLAFTVAAITARMAEPTPQADGIVALTGGDGRVAAALALLAAHAAPALLISGAGPGTYLGDFTADNAAAATNYAAAITIGHGASTTRTNATETASWAAARHMRSLIIVTADYHMPRALAEIAAALPGVRLLAAPVRPPAMDHPLSPATLKLLAWEYSKYLVVRAGFSAAAASLVGP